MQPLDQPLKFQNYTILIVDDIPANLGILFEFLDRAGFEVLVAQDGESGLDKALYSQPDIILLDVLMPDLDGYEVCRRLKSNEATRSIPVIFMTALTGTEDKVQGFEVGAVDYVTKPFQRDELLARLVTHLRLRDLTQKLQQEIVERKRAEEGLTQYRNHLEKLVEERTIALTQTNQKLRVTRARLAEVEELERRRLARELHDRVGQDLGTLDINLNIMQAQFPSDTAQLLRTRLTDSLSLVKQVAHHVHDVMADLRSPVLDDYGLVAALKWYTAQFATRTGLKITVRGDENAPRLAAATESALLRIAQEALTNVARHAQATQVTVSVVQEAHRLHMVIADNGQGFALASLAAPSQGQGWGMISMQERAEIIGGQCQIITEPGRGTQVIVKIAL